ncbi:NifB/NifX family molybdenum-iron cluster-binding protein [Thiorhodovibrio frisius]|uniref:Dinitrogenase iron-molybdenum cofactor biosynthesis domain-containing protein n=1 Tax=Thiorhodovibrio frisius TaxID=631362 RepID=H8YYT6_9GAMM|nr:NifB/NifX family molybdenum-iron cluster-binding protein [Thiorhodovibrio frisius]EIC23612.1 hypothetical protein Thi970DRAFT_01286 [Thiorhodovibrio frisius]WPL23301.1 FeMo cofactor biosynthesis protein NifB [Thiorhodovibrio frisius]
MKIAVASQEGLIVDTHFGHARQFLIYEVSGETCELLERRAVEQYCVGGQSMSSAIDGILAAVSDCHAVLVAMIGEPPRERLAAIGVQAVSDYANQPIDAALGDYARRQASE